MGNRKTWGLIVVFAFGVWWFFGHKQQETNHKKYSGFEVIEESTEYSGDEQDDAQAALVSAVRDPNALSKKKFEKLIRQEARDAVEMGIIPETAVAAYIADRRALRETKELDDGEEMAESYGEEDDEIEEN